MSDISFAVGSEWRRPREEGVPIHLPNGSWIKMRAVTFDLFLKLAHIPDYMTPIVEKMLMEEEIRKPEDVKKDLIEKGVLQLMREDRQLREEFAKVAFVIPRVVDNPTKEDEIAPDDLDYGTLEFIMTFFGMPIDELRPFSDRQVETLQSLERQSNDDDETERIDKVEPVGSGMSEPAG